MAEMISEDETSLVATVKDCLSGHSNKICLYDIVCQETKRVIQQLGDTRFDMNEPCSPTAICQRIHTYDQVTRRLEVIMLLMSYWGDPSCSNTINLTLFRLSETKSPDGFVGWVALRQYPMIRLSYTSGIALVASGNYESLASLLLSEIYSADRHSVNPVAADLSESVLELTRCELFRNIPEYTNTHTPLQAYLFNQLKTVFFDVLYWGHEYERYFDTLEALFALVSADLHHKRYEKYWGPVGRSAWKHHDIRRTNPLQTLLQEAKRHNQNWAPIQAGLFDSSFERFEAVYQGYCQAMFR